MMKLGSFKSAALLMAGTFAAVAVAQTGGGQGSTGLNIPANPQFIGNSNPAVRRATAIVNGDVITQTDVDQRMALILLANQAAEISAEEKQRLREQVLRNLVDETLQIQAAKAAEIKIEPREIETFYQRYLQNLKQTPQQFEAYLRSVGSSPSSLKRQIHGEVAWNRLQSREIEPFVNVSREEVQSVLERLKAAKGTQEFRVGEIFLSSTPETAAETRANASRIVQQLRQGASFAAYARQFSEASTAAVGGDLGWVRAEQLPEPLAQAAQSAAVGTVTDPIPVPGGFSVILVQDTRQILTADPRNAVLSLKQMSISFPAGMKEAEAQPLITRLAQTAQAMGGCGGAEEAAAKIGAEVISSDQVRARDLPPALQNTLLAMSIGQSTPPFGTFEQGVRVLVLCGRDDSEVSTEPSFQQVYAQLEEQRVNMRARRYLRDLRRDAVVDYR
jgi:peptidyl-prolyl cis-trans isomerase SurA